MICGARWKTCDCPWFNYNPVPEDRLHYMNVPGQPDPIQVHYRRVAAANANPHQPHQQYAYNPRNPALNYQQEIDRRRAQERADEQFARRLQVLGFASDDEVDVYGAGTAGTGMGREWGIGNAGGHFLNENYVRNAADLITAPYGQARVRANNAGAGADAGRGLDGAHIVDHAAQAAAAAAAALAAANANPAANTSARRRTNPVIVPAPPQPPPAPAPPQQPQPRLSPSRSRLRAASVAHAATLSGRARSSVDGEVCRHGGTRRRRSRDRGASKQRQWARLRV